MLFRSTDGNGGSDTATLTLGSDITDVNDAPVATDDTFAVTEDTPVSGNVLSNDSDVDGDTLTVTTYSVDTNGDGVAEVFAAGATATINGVGTLVLNADGSFTFTPAADYVGAVPVVNYTITDGTGLTDSAQLVLGPVQAVDDSPRAADDTARTDEDQPVTIDVLGNDRDPDAGDSLTITQVNGVAISEGGTVAVANGTVTLTGGQLVFQPAADFHGTATFQYTVSDGRTPVSANVTVQVDPVNDLPQANNDTVTTGEDQSVTLSPLGNDRDPDGDALTITQIDGIDIVAGATVDLPGKGSVTLNADGTITFTPLPDYNGPVQLTYTISDGHGGTDTATIDIQVQGRQDAPVAQDDAGSTSEDITLSVSAADGVILGAGRDSDVDGDALSVSAVNGQASGVGKSVAGAWGSLTLNADGSYTFVPNAAAQGLDDGESRSDVFTYTVTDPAGNTATATDRKSTRLNSSHSQQSRMPSSA